MMIKAHGLVFRFTARAPQVRGRARRDDTQRQPHAQHRWLSTLPEPEVCLNMQCSDRDERRDRTQPTGLTGWVKGGQNCLPILCRKNREGKADRFLGMAPLRRTGGSVTAHFQPSRNHQDCPAVLSSGTVTAGLNGMCSDLWNVRTGRLPAAHPRGGFTLGVPLSLVGTSPALGHRRGSRA
jgi:hypothetical protein